MTSRTGRTTPIHGETMQSLTGPSPDAPSLATVEQREAPRVALMLRNAKLLIDGKEMLCIVRDVSATGARIRGFHPIPPGKACAIELWEGQAFPIEQAWNDGVEAGYRFSEAKDLDALVHEHGPFPRRPLRINLELDAVVTSAGKTTQVCIRNLSQQGANVETGAEWARFQPLQLEAEGLPVPLPAKVRWQRDGVCGMVFERTFALSDFARLVARLQGLPTS